MLPLRKYFRNPIFLMGISENLLTEYLLMLKISENQAADFLAFQPPAPHAGVKARAGHRTEG
jgi:hypothetical protein